MDWTEPQVLAGIIATAGIVIVSLVNLVVTVVLDRRREHREESARTYEHRLNAYVDFAQTVASWGIRISNADDMHEWPGADYDTFDPVYAKFELVKLYGRSKPVEQGELLFKALSKYGDTTSHADWVALQESLDSFRQVIRKDLGIA